ncbi:MAG: hypothetical protein HKL90_05620 [Elusimicrobia bacterium]|nr:hypothetical protein [Elusimicrobiota bacterium]
MKDNPGPYHKRIVALATKHQKDRVMAPAFRRFLGASVIVPNGIDTDSFGTFSGEIERVGTALDVVRRKARLAVEVSGHPLALASEGSFGPDPACPFFPCGMEVIVFIDDERKIEVVESDLTEETNFSSTTAASAREMQDFLEHARFPSHRLVVAPENEIAPGLLKKGIGRYSELEKAVQAAARGSSTGKALIATDMRAHMNPTRMAGLEKLAEKLARRLASLCPACGAPGWGVVDAVKGLPCESCGAQTELVARDIYGCASCATRLSKPRGDGQKFASACRCPHCNP